MLNNLLLRRSKVREIKFRAWHKYYKQMVTVDWIQLNFTRDMKKYKIAFSQRYDKQLNKDVSDYARQDEIELMQFTGLYDNTKWKQLTEQERQKWLDTGKTESEWIGKEIYEGDILNCSVLGLRIIKYNTKQAAFKHYSLKYNVSSGILKSEIKHDEIIGNIYENKELIQHLSEEK